MLLEELCESGHGNVKRISSIVTKQVVNILFADPPGILESLELWPRFDVNGVYQGRERAGFGRVDEATFLKQEGYLFLPTALEGVSVKPPKICCALNVLLRTCTHPVASQFTNIWASGILDRNDLDQFCIFNSGNLRQRRTRQQPIPRFRRRSPSHTLMPVIQALQPMLQ